MSDGTIGSKAVEPRIARIPGANRASVREVILPPGFPFAGLATIKICFLDIPSVLKGLSPCSHKLIVVFLDGFVLFL